MMSSQTKRVPNFNFPYESRLQFLRIFLVFSTIFVLTGGLYIILKQPPLFHPIPIRDQPVEIYSISESFFSAILVLIGFGGFLSIYRASRYAYDSRKSWTLLIVGILAILLATYSLQVFFDYKASFWN